MNGTDDYIVKLFCYRFYSELNIKNFGTIFDVSHNLRSEVVYDSGSEIFETSVPVNFTAECSGNKEVTKDILIHLSSKFELLPNENLLKYEKHEDGLFVLSVNGRARTRKGDNFGIFRQMVQFTVKENYSFSVKNLISKIVSSKRVVSSGIPEEMYFENNDLN